MTFPPWLSIGRQADRGTPDTAAERPIGLRAELACALGLALLLSLGGALSHTLWTPDEPVGAAVGANMLRSGDFVVSRLGGQPFTEKPPLYWWLQVAAYRLFGVHDVVARLPSSLFTVLTLLLVYAVGRRLQGPRLGFTAMAVLGTMPQFAEDMQRAIVDPALVFFVFAAWCAIAFEDVTGKPSWRSGAVVALATGCSFLSKGWVGPILASAVPGTAVLLRNPRRLRRAARWWALGILGVVVIGAPWVVAVAERAGPAVVREGLIRNTTGRLFGTEGIETYGHRQPVWYYLASMVVAGFPTILAVPAALRDAVDRAREGKLARLWLVTSAIGVAALSLAVSKRATYLLPLLPGVAFATAQWMTRPAARHGDSRLERWTVRLLVGTARLAPFGMALGALGLAWSPGRYRAAMSGQPAVQVVMTLIASVALLGGVVAWARLTDAWDRAARPLSAARLLVPLVCLVLFWQTAAKWALDPIKRWHDTTAALAAATASGASIALWSGRTRTEKLSAMIDYDLGRATVVVGDAGSVEQYFRGNPRGALLVSCSTLADLPPSFARLLHLTYDERGRKATPYAILALPPARGPRIP